MPTSTPSFRHRLRLALLARPRLLVWLGLVLSGLMVVALTAHSVWQSRQLYLEQARVLSQSLATVTDAYLVAHLDSIHQTLTATVDAIEREQRPGAVPAQHLREHVEDMRSHRPEVDQLLIADATGRVLAYSSAGPRLPMQVADQGWFQVHQEPDRVGLHITLPYQDAASGEWYLSFSRGLHDTRGRPAGVVAARVPMSYVASLLTRVDTGPHGAVLLRDTQLRQFGRHPVLLGEQGRFGLANASPELRALQSDPIWRSSNYTATGPDGVRKIYTVRRLEIAPLMVIVGVAEDDQLLGWRREARSSVAMALVFLMIWGGGSLLLLRALRLTQKARERAHLLTKVFEHSGEAILVTDRDNRIIEVNPAFVAQTGYPPAEVLGQNPRVLASGRTSADEYRQMWQTLLSEGRWRGELWDRAKDGRITPKWMSISVVRDEAGAITHHIGHSMDLSQQKAAEAHIVHLAHHDTLTGLPNRVLLQGRLEQALASARREGGQLAMLFIDLDRFKDINDSLGHHVGDALLIEVAQRLRGVVRESDIVARLGGDEFVLVLTGLGQEGQPVASAIASKVLEALRQPVQVEGHALHSSTSIGIAIFPVDGDQADTLMKGADAAMYHAKAAGRDTFHFYTAAMNEASSERLALEQGLRVAVARGELFLEYQPQVAVRSGQVVAVEALLRWRHPERGLISPMKFVPVAEETGLIGGIGHWVLCEALGQLRRWHDAGLADLRMAVNLSAQQLRDEGFANSVAGELRRNGLPGSALELEVTESTAMRDPARTAQQLRQLRALGVALAIDDFGTGYSSLAYLKQLPLSCLKLDRSFVMDIEHDPNDAAISAATITLAHNLGLAVVAEGVENQAQLDFLGRLHCDLVQGYHFSTPLGAEACQAFIERLNGPTR